MSQLITNLHMNKFYLAFTLGIVQNILFCHAKKLY